MQVQQITLTTANGLILCLCVNARLLGMFVSATQALGWTINETRLIAPETLTTDNFQAWATADLELQKTDQTIIQSVEADGCKVKSVFSDTDSSFFEITRGGKPVQDDSYAQALAPIPSLRILARLHNSAVSYLRQQQAATTAQA